MEYKRIEITMSSGFYDRMQWVYPEVSEMHDYDTEISTLLNDGWRIVSTAPITASMAVTLDGSSSKYDNPNRVFPFTSKIMVFLVKE